MLAPAMTRPATAFLALLAMSTTAAAEVQEAGSVLVFPVQNDVEARLTIISVTNTDTTPATPASFGGSTLVHYEYLTATRNPDAPFLPTNCVVNNRFEMLTPADTLSVNVECHNPALPDQGGYLVATAVAPTGGDWSHNHLTGSLMVLYPSGAAYSMNAISLGAIPDAGELTDLNGNGLLDFDDQEYESLPDFLFADSFIAVANQNLTLLSLTGRSTDIHTVGLTIWNDNEFPLSATIKFRCWFNEPLARISGVFTENFLENATPNDPEELDFRCNGVGILETGWFRVDSLGVRTPGGFPVAADGALLGALTANRFSLFDAGRPLFGSEERQFNGTAVNF